MKIWYFGISCIERKLDDIYDAVGHIDVESKLDSIEREVEKLDCCCSCNN